MVNTNYLTTIVKILETPHQQFVKTNLSVIKFRAQLPQTRNTQIITVLAWGKLATKLQKFYNSHDYIIIEGYLSLRKEKIQLTALGVFSLP